MAEHFICRTCGWLNSYSSFCPQCGSRETFNPDEPQKRLEMNPRCEVTVTIDLYDGAPISDQARQIMGQIAPHVLKSFLDKNADYGDTSFELGLAGQYAELWRKIGKLKGPMWEGKDDLKFEGMEEIISDLIGHCLLSLYFIRNNKP